MRVKDISPGGESLLPSSLTNVNGTLFFVTHSEGFSDQELWKSDGTAAGTVVVKQLGGAPASNLTNVKGTLFFTVGNLWKSNGTAAGTVLVSSKPGSRTSQLEEVNGRLFFVACSAEFDTDCELWNSDGTDAGTVRVKDIFPGEQGSSPSFLTDGNGTLFFQANDGTSGKELWQSDGTEAGTVLVADLIPGSGGSGPRDLTVVGSSLFFSAIGEGIGRELWMLPIPEPDASLLGLACFGALAAVAWRRRRPEPTHEGCQR